MRTRTDDCPALFVTEDVGRLTYDGLRAILTRRSELAGLNEIPSAYDFRRTLVLEFFTQRRGYLFLSKDFGACQRSSVVALPDVGLTKMAR